MAKDKTELIQGLMHKPAFIRNIGIAAHIDHGKCISGESRIHLASGSIKTAKDVFDTNSKQGIQMPLEENGIVYDISNSNLYVNSFEKTNGKIVSKKITHIWKMQKTDPLVCVKLKNGLVIKTTPEHKFILWENGKIEEKRADSLTLSDILICPRATAENHTDISNIKEYILRKLGEDPRFYVFVDNDTALLICNLVKSHGIKKVWKKISSQWDYGSFGFSLRKGRYRTIQLLQIAEMFGISLEKIYDGIEFLNLRGVASKGVHSSVNMKLPKSDKEFSDLFYLIGLMFGDGNTQGNLDNADEQIQKEAIRIAQEVLGLKEAKLKIYGIKCPRVYIGAETFRHFLNKLFDFPLIKKSNNIKIPEIVYLSNLKLAGRFISGYFDTDGTIEKGRSAVSVCSSSKRMLKDLQILLLKFGIPSQYYDKKSTLYISGRTSLDLFARKINFELESKKTRSISLLSKAENSRNITFVSSDASNGLLYSSNLLEETYFCQVAEISRTDSEDFVYDFSVDHTHNFVAEGMIIHNTTLTDNLLAGAGMISDELAGSQLFTDFDKQEQERGITIFAANVSMVHEVEGKDYLINLIDTPGHVDFGGDVTRAMRAVDGAVILVDAVESVMPQTETVIRQALHERVKPVLFINKVDRLIKELQLTPEQMQERFMKIIMQVNLLIQKYSENQFHDKFLVNVENGSVAFGSAYRKWAISVPYMKREKITFKDIIEYTSQGKDKELAKIAPLHKIVLDMVIHHLPNPADAQKYRLSKVWHGDLEGPMGKDMLAMNEKGGLAGIITKVIPDPHAGLVATARLFSGSIRRGQEVRLVGQHKTVRVQQVSIYKGPQRIQMEEIPAGNIVGIVGLTDAFSGETVCDVDKEIEPFEAIKHIFEPVVTKSIECSDPKDLQKMIMFLRQTSREDPTLAIKINEETGEYLISGLGELHIDAKVERPMKDKGIDVKTSPPIVIYRETVRALSPEVEGKSSNKHNRFYLTVEPLEEGVYQAIADGRIDEASVRKNLKQLIPVFVECGLSRDEAKKIEDVHNRNVLIDATKGIQYLNETMELIIDAFRRIMEEGPLAHEPCFAVKIKITDAKLHEDAIHRGPAQVLPAIGDAIREAVYKARPTLLEPLQTIRIDIPEELMGNVMSLIQNRRGQIVDTRMELGIAIIEAKLPVAEMFGFEALLKSATGGKGFYSLIDVTFERVPEEIKMQTIMKIRQRKGMTGEPGSI